MIRPIARIDVTPSIPPRLERLLELAYNLRWSWDHDAINLFRRLDRDLWESTGRNPVLMLGQLSQDKLNAAAEDEAFMSHLDRVCATFDHYMSQRNTWFRKQYGNFDRRYIAYFSTEFGITECLRNYSGGLGVLSGDHLKSASDLDLPMVGVGILYQEGYFRQYLSADGYQQEAYPINDYSTLPVRRVMDGSGNPLKIKVPMPGRDMSAQAWLVQVGRVPLYLLDSNLPENVAEDRDLTDRLYGGDRRTRIRQEILLGIGGIRLLEALGLRPLVCHMNEGHSAFLTLERIRILMEESGIDFEAARHITAAGNIFTTHTSVPAGLERFGFDLIDEHFTPMFEQLHITRDQFLSLGRENMGNYELFSMTVLSLKLSAAANAVAKLHGRVSREMWQWLYPKLPSEEVPVDAITNGIHVTSWLSQEMSQLLDRYLDPSWRENPDDKNIWKEIERIPDAELWRSHERRRERLVAFARRRLRAQLERRGVPQSEIDAADEVLNPDALTFGFARRFATYKRGTLLFHDPERLIRLLNIPNCPVQIIFAGKAHPHDHPGKDMIRAIVNHARHPDLRHKIVFLENYDITIARYLVQGVDVWLNTPRRPKEASGTSGMKALYNGGLNASILDGWWDEGYDRSRGWAIGDGEERNEPEWELQDYVESQALYDILEKDIIPLFYERGRDGIPHDWIGKMKNSMRDLSPEFNTHRMIRQYTTLYYIPARERVLRLTQPDLSNSKEYLDWWDRVNHEWNGVKIEQVEAPETHVTVGQETEVRAVVRLGKLAPEEVKVQFYYGKLDTEGFIENGKAIDMVPVGNQNNGTYEFAAKVAYEGSGERGVSVRVLPYHPYLNKPFQPGLLRWAAE